MTSNKITKIYRISRGESKVERPTFRQSITPDGIRYAGTIDKVNVSFVTASPLPDHVVRNLLNWRLDRFNRNRS